MTKRYSILTYNINNYEVIHEVEQMDPEAEYVLVTDDKDMKSSSWTIVYDEDLEGLSAFDKTFAIRYNVFKYCNTDICVRIDGSMGLKLSLKPLIDIFEDGGYDVCLMPHPHRSDIKEEYNAWVSYRGYDRNQANRCIKKLEEKGYDFNYKGLFQSGFVIQRRGEITCRIDKEVYGLMKELSTNGIIERLDQTLLSFVINHYFSHLKVLPISSQILSSAYLQLYMHGGNVRNLYHMPDFRKEDIHYMFNKKVNCLYMPTPLDSNIIADREYQLMYELLKSQEENNRLSNTEDGKEAKRIWNKSYKRLKIIRKLIYLIAFLLLTIIALTIKIFLI